MTVQPILFAVGILLGSLGSSEGAPAAAPTPDTSAAATPWFNGINIPWNSFGHDVGEGTFNATFFDTFFAGAARDGANVARWWLHADGRGGLRYGADGSVAGLTPSFLPDLAALGALAKKHAIVLQVCLWSFDMCKTSEFPGQVARADLVSDAAKTASYVATALRPLLATLAGSLGPGGVVMEVINEPEWCMTIDASQCNTDVCVAPRDMQRFVGTVAAAVHEAGLKVTVGSAALKWDAAGGSALGNWWNDTALRAAAAGSTATTSGSGGGGGGGGGSPTLDHYQVHYYDWMFDPSWGYDPCREDVAYWALDKPTVVGELPASSAHYSAAQMMACAKKNGFIGDVFWAYNDPALPLAPALPALAGFAKDHAAEASYAALSKWLAAPTPAPAAPTPGPAPAPTPCTDEGPDANSCAQQKSWGKCDVKANPWMAGYCCKTCFDCDPKCGRS